MYCSVNYSLEVDEFLEFLGIFRPIGILLCYLIRPADEIEVFNPAVPGIVILELNIVSLGDFPIDLLPNDPVFESPPL